MKPFPCWCWREPTTTTADACGFCEWPKSHHHDNRRRGDSGHAPTPSDSNANGSKGES